MLLAAGCWLMTGRAVAYTMRNGGDGRSWDGWDGLVGTSAGNVDALSVRCVVSGFRRGWVAGFPARSGGGDWRGCGAGGEGWPVVAAVGEHRGRRSAVGAGAGERVESPVRGSGFVGSSRGWACVG